MGRGGGGGGGEIPISIIAVKISVLFVCVCVCVCDPVQEAMLYPALYLLLADFTAVFKFYLSFSV